MNLTIDVIPAWQLLTYSSSSKSKGLAFWKPVALGKKKPTLLHGAHMPYSARSSEKLISLILFFA